MKLPASVLIAGMRYRIEWRKKSWKLSNDMRVDGTCWPADHELAVNKALAGDRRAMVLLHEIMHAACDAAELQLPDKVEEEIVSHLSRVLFQILRDNPRVVRYLLKAK